MPKIADVIHVTESFAPLALQEEYDNSGLQYGDIQRELTGVTVTLDLTPAVASEAVRRGDNLIISHHPSLFHPVSAIDTSKPELKAVEICIRNGIAVYAAHTNADKCKGGLNDHIIKMLGAEALPFEEGKELPRFAVLKEAVSLREFARIVSEKLSDEGVRFVGDPEKKISKFAVITGGGGDLEALQAAKAGGADVFLSGDFKYHVIRFAKDAGYAIISFGHYESERPFIGLVADKLRAQGFENVREAECLENPYYSEGRI